MFGCLGNFLWKSRRIIGEDVHIPITRVSAIVCPAGNIFFLGFWGKFENSIRNLSKTGELSLESNISLCLLLSERSTQGNMRCYKALGDLILEQKLKFAICTKLRSWWLARDLHGPCSYSQEVVKYKLYMPGVQRCFCNLIKTLWN